MIRAFHKQTGSEVIGTLESCPGVALAQFSRGEDGSLTYEYTGQTNMWWDEQKTQFDDGVIFVCEDGNTCSEDEIELRDETEVPHDAD